MVTFSLYLRYEGEFQPRIIASDCDKTQLLSILERHLMLAEVEAFHIIPFEYDPERFTPVVKEYTL